MLIKTKSGTTYKLTADSNGTWQIERGSECFTGAFVQFARATLNKSGRFFPVGIVKSPALNLFVFIRANDGRNIVTTPIVEGFLDDGYALKEIEPPTDMYTVKEEGKYPCPCDNDSKRTVLLIPGLSILTKSANGFYNAFTGLGKTNIELTEDEVVLFDYTGKEFSFL